jgi:hypothetical protein
MVHPDTAQFTGGNGMILGWLAGGSGFGDGSPSA